MPAEMSERDDVRDTVTGMLHAIDALDWDGVAAALAAKLHVDYSSLFGGGAESLTAEALLQRWRGLVPGFDATQHLTGPVLVSVDGDTATADTHVRGYHQVAGTDGGSVWQVAGHYAMELTRDADRWRITSITLQTFYQEGDPSLPELAAARVSSGSGRR